MNTHFPTRRFALLALPVVAGLLAVAPPAGADDDPGLTIPPRVTVGDASRCESSSGSFDFGWLSIPVTLDKSPASTVTVNYATVNASAVAFDDYTPKSGTLTFEPSQGTTKYISVPIKHDVLAEPNQWFGVQLSGLTGPATPVDMSAIGTILDDDPMKIHVSNASADEGSPLSFKITRCGSVADPAGVKYATSNGTAVSPSDYQPQSAFLTFASGVRVRTVAVSTSQDNVSEGTETMKMTLSSPVGVSMGDGVGIGTIHNVDTIY